MSLGLAESPPGDETPLWDLVAEADARMFDAKCRKKGGRTGGSA